MRNLIAPRDREPCRKVGCHEPCREVPVTSLCHQRPDGGSQRTRLIYRQCRLLAVPIWYVNRDSRRLAVRFMQGDGGDLVAQFATDGIRKAGEGYSERSPVLPFPIPVIGYLTPPRARSISISDHFRGFPPTCAAIHERSGSLSPPVSCSKHPAEPAQSRAVSLDNPGRQGNADSYSDQNARQSTFHLISLSLAPRAKSPGAAGNLRPPKRTGRC